MLKTLGLKKQWLCCCLPALALLCLGWADSWEGLRAAADRVTSVQAQFVQQKHLPILAKPLISKGTFYYQAPDSLRWEYRWPLRSILLMHHGQIKRYVEGPQGFSEEKGTNLQAMQVILGDITQWLAGHFDDNPMFNARLEPGRKIILTPKDKALSAVIQRVELVLSRQPGVMERVLIYEGPDSYTEMIFSDTVLNQPIDSAVFQSIP